MGDGLSPFECPLCFDCFNGEENLPCVLTCGHSLCISHIPALTKCPICRHELARELMTSSKPCYALRDGAILYYKLVDTVAQSSHVQPSGLASSSSVTSSTAETAAVHPTAGAGSDISLLTSMGFNRTSVEAAFVAHDGDFSATLDYFMQLGDIDCALGPTVPPRPPAPIRRVSSGERRSGTGWAGDVGKILWALLFPQQYRHLLSLFRRPPSNSRWDLPILRWWSGVGELRSQKRWLLSGVQNAPGSLEISIVILRYMDYEISILHCIHRIQSTECHNQAVRTWWLNVLIHS